MLSLLVLLVAAGALGFTVRDDYFTTGTQFAAVIEPPVRVNLNFPGLGVLSALDVAPGQRVRAGQVLAEQNRTVATAIVAADEATLTADQARIGAIEQNQVPNTPPIAANIEAAQAQVSRDAAALAAAKAALADLILVSPINGVVTAVTGVVGDLAGTQGVSTAGTAATQVPTGPTVGFFPPAPSAGVAASSSQSAPLITIEGGGAWDVIAQVPEIDLAKLRQGVRARIVVDSATAHSLTARFGRLVASPVLVGGATYYDAVFVLTNSPSYLLPGLTANVILTS